jgi:hypothetical protein
VTSSDATGTTPEALFEPHGDGAFLPTAASAGPWAPDVLHGGAVGALLAGLLEHPEQVMMRVLVELGRPVPSGPLRAEVGPVDGGRRVVRQSVVLSAADRPVARAHALRMRRGDVALPDDAARHDVVFDPADVPDLDRPNERAARAVGRPSFDSVAMATHVEGTRPGPCGTRRAWLKLLVPVVAGRRASAVERVVAAADFAATGTFTRLGFGSWSFMNADLVVSLSRPPAGGWVGLECDGFLGHTGTGQSVATIYDTEGPLGRASQSILLEARGPGTNPAPTTTNRRGAR